MLPARYDDDDEKSKCKIGKLRVRIDHQFKNWGELETCSITVFDYYYSPVGWGRRMHRLHFCRLVRVPPDEYFGYDTKQSDGKPPVLEI